QKAAISGAEENTRRCILEKLDLQLSSDFSTFRIADFGCSIGPNTFHVAQSIIDTVKLKHLKENNKNSVAPLEFQVFFNDQTTNDINTLFRTQPPSSEREYFSVGVPGSFYGRVLPRNSIHIGHTSYTIHWLSKVPEHVCDKKSMAWNKNYIQCNNLLEEVTKAYKVQFIEDMDAFLDARGEELVPGGLMTVIGECLHDGVSLYETWHGFLMDIASFFLILYHFIYFGITSEEKIDVFSLPVYFPQFSELKGEIERNGSFTIELMETTSHPLEGMPLTNEFITSTFRAFLTTIIEKHFGDGVVDELFDRLAKKLYKHPIDFEMRKKQVVYYIVLKRK
ncbi:unnamed protein product, partial [Arabidopsis halleri]